MVLELPTADLCVSAFYWLLPEQESTQNITVELGMSFFTLVFLKYENLSAYLAVCKELTVFYYRLGDAQTFVNKKLGFIVFFKKVKPICVKLNQFPAVIALTKSALLV